MDKRHLIALFLVPVVFLGVSVYRTQVTLQSRDTGIVLYDQLSTVYSPIDFKDGIRDCSTTLGSEMSYHNASEVTVNLLKRTPRARLLILRMHSGIFEEGLWLFSGEQYTSSRYVMDQIRGSVHMARCSSTSEVVFAVGEGFIEECWTSLDDTLVILMGCEGMAETSLSEVLVDCGAVGVVGWNRAISIETSDSAILDLVRSLARGKTLGSVIDRINKEYGEIGMLVYCPESLSSYVFPR